MDLTRSYQQHIPGDILARYQFAETRNAAAIFAATNPTAFEQLQDVLRSFHLKTSDLLTPGGQESDLAARMNRAFRDGGWREARVDTLIQLSLQRTPLASAGETRLDPIVTETRNEGYKVDNFRDRIALDMEWNAKDGNLDRDIGAYRSLYDAALIDVGVLITRTMSLRELGRRLGEAAGMAPEQAKRILNTTTTTNREKLLPRLTRGDAGGCPILAIFICPETHTPD
ncbi:MAG: BglII/BstYI family type II restriction endonuclease [Thermomonas sp.]|uniref:BglII/BstYI family type II restriction endonuclease n=1 Tax=Thermomonas sp. TaxID=1971895 RepID=UPI0039E45C99